MNLDKTNISCGIYQLNGICHPPKDIIKYVVDTLKEKTVAKTHGWTNAHAKPPVIIFSDLAEKGAKGGAALANYIAVNGLGEITCACTLDNPVLHNIISLWVWELNYDALGLSELKKGSFIPY